MRHIINRNYVILWANSFYIPSQKTWLPCKRPPAWKRWEWDTMAVTVEWWFMRGHSSLKRAKSHVNTIITSVRDFKKCTRQFASGKKWIPSLIFFWILSLKISAISGEHLKLYIWILTCLCSYKKGFKLLNNEWNKELTFHNLILIW